MSRLRASIAKLPRFPAGAINVSEVAEFVHLERPVSVRQLMATIDALPGSLTFRATIVTGSPLGGEVTVVLNKDGSYRFSGFMRATGLPSYSCRIVAIVRSVSGNVALALWHSGKVHGTDTTGNRKDEWDKAGSDQEEMKLIRNVWPDICAGTMEVKESHELGGVLGTALDIAKDVAEFYVAAQTLGAPFAVCLVMGSEAGDAGVSVPGLGGVVGLGIVGGALFIWGPYSIGPAIILGLAAGAAVEAWMVKIRKLTAEEQAFASLVFGDSIDYERVRLTNLLGFSGRPFTMPTVDNTILVNIGDRGNAYDAPTQARVAGKYPMPGQLLIHELTHVWQIQHATLEDGYVPGVMCGLIGEQAKGDSSYGYGPAGQPWASYTGEGKASIVDQWFGGTGGQKGKPMDKDGKYFRYINDNIRLGIG